MNMWLDFLLTILLMVACFGGACYLAWREGRPLSAQGRKALRAVPYFGLCATAYSATYVLWPPAGYEHQYVQARMVGDTVLALVLTGLAATFSKVAPMIFDAGAAHHPAPVVQRSAQEIHMRRRHWNAALKQAIPLFVLGLGVSAITLSYGISNMQGGWIVGSLLGAEAWLLVVTLIVCRSVRNSIRRALGEHNTKVG